MPDKILLDKKTKYQHLRVVENDSAGRKVRIMYLNDVINGAYFTDSDEHYCDYTQCLKVGYPEEAPSKILMFGLGGATLVKDLLRHYPSAHIDALEIDPDVIDASKKYFLPETLQGYTIHNMDAREFLKKNKKQYDLVVNDAFIGDNPDASLLSPSSIHLVKQNLSEKGRVVINIISELYGPFFKQTYISLEANFNNVYAFPGEGRIREVQNIILVADDLEPKTREDFARNASPEAKRFVRRLVPPDDIVNILI